MRITRVLLKESHRWRFRQLWQTKARFVEHPTIMPSFIKDRGVELTNAKDYIKPQPKFPQWEPPVKDDPMFVTKVKTIKDLPDYHEDPVYEFNPSSCLIEGDKQACLLTKTQPFYELPDSVLETAELPVLPDQDLLVQRAIMQANIWDPTKDKLPKRQNPDLPIWNFKAEFGIPQRRINSIMIRNLVRLCEMLGSWYPDLAASRRTITDPYLSTFYYFQDDKHVSVSGTHNAMVYADRPLKPFADEETIDASAMHVLPDIFPLLPTIDLTKQHVWRAENVTGLRDGYRHHYPHTLFIACDDLNWTTSQRNASALMFCFGHTLALAKQKYGWDSKELPEPIATQCVVTDGVRFQFTCFQLNTLDYSSSDGIKNCVWFTPQQRPMYNKLIPKRAMLRNTKYEDYDPALFRQIVAFYTNGSTLGGHGVRTEAAAVVQS